MKKDNPYHPYLNKFHKESTEKKLAYLKEQSKSPIDFEKALKHQKEFEKKAKQMEGKN